MSGLGHDGGGLVREATVPAPAQDIAPGKGSTRSDDRDLAQGMRIAGRRGGSSGESSEPFTPCLFVPRSPEDERVDRGGARAPFQGGNGRSAIVVSARRGRRADEAPGRGGVAGEQEGVGVDAREMMRRRCRAAIVEERVGIDVRVVPIRAVRDVARQRTKKKRRKRHPTSRGRRGRIFSRGMTARHGSGGARGLASRR